MTDAHLPDGTRLPDGVVWAQRDFPNANFLLLQGEQAALVDTGFVAHADATAQLAKEHSPTITRVINTHWHADHVGGNALLQSTGAEILGPAVDADALERADPGCCVAEYLDQPVARYTVDTRVGDGDRVLLGDSEWEIVAVPGHTPGHLAFWNSEHRLLAVGDALSSYDIGWINVMLDGPALLDAASASLSHLREFDAAVILPGHGPAITEPAPAVDKAISRVEKQQQNLDLAVSYGAKRILAFALMIHGGIPAIELDDYLARQPWARDAAGLLGQSIDEFVRGLVDPMLASGAAKLEGGRVLAAQRATAVDPSVFDLPFPREWMCQSPKSARGTTDTPSERR